MSLQSNIDSTTVAGIEHRDCNQTIVLNPLNANPTKCWNTPKQLPTNSLSLFDLLMWLTLKGLGAEGHGILTIHSVILGTDSLPQANYKPAIFTVPPGTEKLNKFPPRQIKSPIISVCCTCWTITLILISEQPTNTS